MTNRTQVKRFKNEEDANAFLDDGRIECLRVIPTTDDLVIVYRSYAEFGVSR